jgi:hypothetical protein
LGTSSHSRGQRRRSLLLMRYATKGRGGLG